MKPKISHWRPLLELKFSQPTEAWGRAIQAGQLTPSEARILEGLR